MSLAFRRRLLWSSSEGLSSSIVLSCKFRGQPILMQVTSNHLFIHQVLGVILTLLLNPLTSTQLCKEIRSAKGDHGMSTTTIITLTTDTWHTEYSNKKIWGKKTTKTDLQTVTYISLTHNELGTEVSEDNTALSKDTTSEANIYHDHPWPSWEEKDGWWAMAHTKGDSYAKT